MKLTFAFDMKLNETQEKIVREIKWHVSKVYNTLNYSIREGKSGIDFKEKTNEEMYKIYRKYRENNWHSKYLHSHTLEQIILNCMRDHKSYLALKKLYEKGDKRIKEEPRKPGYKHGEVQITFTKQGIRRDGRKIKISISKKMQEKFKVKSLNFLIPKKLEKLVNLESIKMIKIGRLMDGRCKIYIIYEKEEKDIGLYGNTMAIDLGMNNIATCVTANDGRTRIFAGESLKSKIGYINKEISRLESIQMHMVGSKNYKNTKRINRLYRQRENYSNTYLHKVSKDIIEFAKETGCSRIVIGDIKNIKQNMKHNKRFVEMPIQKLVEKIEYKAKLIGIEVEKITEEYTSGVSSIDKEEINRENYNKKRRIKRGLFKTNSGKIINADVNGALNILRKYIKEVFSPNLEIAMDIGREQRPLKKRVA